jgi:Zn-dependent protease
LHFSLLGFPVRVHPMFWVMTALMAWSGGELPPQILLIWVGVVFVSILVHELGHAVAARYFGGQASIVLYQFGGLAMHYPAPQHVWQRVAISLAGPAAGFLLAIATMLLVGGTGHRIEFELDWIPLTWSRIAEPNAGLAVDFLMFVNVYWGLFNLLPIFPLDGGQVARNLLVRYDYRDGLRKSHWISVIVAAGLAVYVWVDSDGQRMLTVLMLGFLAFQNYQELRSPWGSRNPW